MRYAVKTGGSRPCPALVAPRTGLAHQLRDAGATSLARLEFDHLCHGFAQAAGAVRDKIA